MQDDMQSNANGRTIQRYSTYRLVVKIVRRGDLLFYEIALQTLTGGIMAICLCKTKLIVPAPPRI